MTVMDIDWLKVELAKPGRSQSALARHMNVATSAINRLVNGGRDLKVREVEAIHAYLRETEAGEESQLASRIRRLMVRRGTNQFRLAQDSGLKADYVRDILRGKVQSPGAEKLAILARALGVTVDALLESEDPAASSPSLAVNAGRVKLNLTAEVSIATAARILQMIDDE